MNCPISDCHDPIDFASREDQSGQLPARYPAPVSGCRPAMGPAPLGCRIHRLDLRARQEWRPPIHIAANINATKVRANEEIRLAGKPAEAAGPPQPHRICQLDKGR